jgi:phosphatidylglycerol:prolipoprotein diacylglycerol transferase
MMWPYDIPIGPVNMSGYGLMFLLAAAGGLALLLSSSPRCGVDAWRAVSLGFWLTIAGVMGSRLAYVLFHLRRFSLDPLAALRYWQGGLMFHGGLLAGLALVLILAAARRINLLTMGDALAPSLALGQAVGRIGCLLAGCCYGFPTPAFFPFPLVFSPDSLAPPFIPLYPTQPVESLGLFAITFILLGMLKRARPAGHVMASYLVMTGLLRFVVDSFRGDFRGPRIMGLVPTSWMSLMICLTGLWLFFWLKRRQKRLALAHLRKAAAAGAESGTEGDREEVAASGETTTAASAETAETETCSETGPGATAETEEETEAETEDKAKPLNDTAEEPA